MCLFLPAKKEKKNNSGTILILTLWVLVILTVFAIALGQRASLEVKLAEYQRDALKAKELAKAAIERAILEKENDASPEVDALNESWANNEAIFKDFALGEGTFNVSYSLEGTTLYGMQDEESKININEIKEVDMPILVKLLENCGVEDTEKIASSIVIWCGKKQDIADEEEAYYQSQELPYHCKKEKLSSIAELLLVRGVTPAILYGEDKDDDGKISQDEQGIAQYLTVFGESNININTASEEVLKALISGAFPGLDSEELTGRIIAYRNGLDGNVGTSDDNIFSITGKPAQLFADQVFFNVYGATFLEWEKLQALQSAGKLSVSSKAYTIYSQAEVEGAKSSIYATIEFSEPEKVKYLKFFCL